MSGYWNVGKAAAKTKTGQKIISKVVDYVVKKTPRKFKVSKTIKSQPPHTGTLKVTRKSFDEMAGSASKGRSLHGKEWTTKTLMKQPHGTKLHGIVSKGGELRQKVKKFTK